MHNKKSGKRAFSSDKGPIVMKHVRCAVEEGLKLLISHRDASVVGNASPKTATVITGSVRLCHVANMR